jgi:hypothetical protein
MATPTHVLIGSTTLPSDTSTITIGSIPQTYKDLHIVCTMRNANTTYFYIQPNGFNSGYQCVWLSGSFGSYVSSGSTNSGYASPTFNHASVSNKPSVQIVDIFNYSVTNQHKNIWASGGAGNQATGYSASRMPSNAAITSINFSGDTNFLAGSTIYIYGIEA